MLGYRVTLPPGYRRASGTIIVGQAEILGSDFFTGQTEAEAREACLRDSGGIGSARPATPDLVVAVSRNVRGLSALAWTASSPYAPLQKLEAVTVNGQEAVRVIADNAGAETNAFVINANGRIYVLYPPVGPPPKTWLDDIAKTFFAITPTAFPSPTASLPPRVAAGDVANALAKAFEARDADAVARLTTGCSIGLSWEITDGPTPGHGGQTRSVALFTDALRDLFRRNALTVVVDPTVQMAPPERGGQFFVLSEWREPDRTTQIRLEFGERDGRWVWTSATHLYASAQVVNGCIPYRSPWVATTASC